MFLKIVAVGTPPMIKAQQRNLQTIARASCQEKGQWEKLHPKQWIAVSRVAFAFAFASFIWTGMSENDLIFYMGMTNIKVVMASILICIAESFHKFQKWMVGSFKDIFD